METVNLLEFLNSVKDLNALEYAQCDSNLFNFLSLMSEEEQFTRHIDLGVMYIYNKALNQYVIVDGLNRILSLSLLLHAVCECYKKTTAKNESAIRTIRKKYLLDGTKTKLKLPKHAQVIYEKILFGERLSGREKQNHMFVLLHNFWSQIKEDGLQAAYIFKMLQKIQVRVVDSGDDGVRDLYYSLNKGRKEINGLLLIENYLKSLGIKDDWTELKEIFNNKTADIKLFFKDYFVTKFNFKEFAECRLYEMFSNYFDTMKIYQSPMVIMGNITKTAKLYDDILNIRFDDTDIKNAFVKIKMYKGEDTHAYLLNIYEDFVDGNINKGTFMEILSTIIEYLQNRTNTPNNVGFNELIQYLNAFIACK